MRLACFDNSYVLCDLIMAFVAIGTKNYSFQASQFFSVTHEDEDTLEICYYFVFHFTQEKNLF